MAAASCSVSVGPDLRVRVSLVASKEYSLSKDTVTTPCGIQLQTSQATGETTIAALKDGGLGAAAGLRAGMRVLEINGTRLNGETGAVLAVKILRAASGKCTIKASSPTVAMHMPNAAATAKPQSVAPATAVTAPEEIVLEETPAIVGAAPAKKEMVRSASFGRRLLSRAASFGRRPAVSQSGGADENGEPAEGGKRTDSTGVKIQRTSSFGRRAQKRTEHTVCIERDFRDAPLNFTLAHVPGVGVVVTEVEAGCAVAKAGLKVGDVIAGINSSSEISSASEATTALRRILGTVELRVVRIDGKRNGGLPKGWKSAIEPETGRTLFYEMKKSAAVGGKPFLVGPIRKARGAGTGIGLRNDDDDSRAGAIVAYVEPGSVLEGRLAVDDEILEVNGVSVRGHAKNASRAIVDADSLTLLVQSKRWCARTTYQNPAVMPVGLAKPKALRQISVQMVN